MLFVLLVVFIATIAANYSCHSLFPLAAQQGPAKVRRPSRAQGRGEGKARWLSKGMGMGREE